MRLLNTAKSENEKVAKMSADDKVKVQMHVHGHRRKSLLSLTTNMSWRNVSAILMSKGPICASKREVVTSKGHLLEIN